MYLEVNYYSKNEYSVDYYVNDLYNQYSNEQRELLLLTIYLIRIYINLGLNPVGKLLSLFLLIYKPEELIALSKDKISFPSAVNLTRFTMMAGMDKTVDAELLYKLILSERPTLVKNRGNGKMRFYLTLSPCKMKQEGFGLLGKNFNYCAFHSIFGVISKMADNNRLNPDFGNNVKEVVSSVSRIYLENSLTPFMNVEDFSLSLLKKEKII